MTMATTDPHHPYIRAVQHTLGALHDPAESWTEYASDNGEVMLMETVIQLNWRLTDAAGWTGEDDRVYLFWDQVHGWTWSYSTQPGRTSEPMPLLTGPLVPDPVDVARAVRLLLDGESAQLPVESNPRPYSDAEPIALTAELTEAVGDGTDTNSGNIDQADAVALAAYADPIRGMTDALAIAGLYGATASPDEQCAVAVRMNPAAGRALGEHLGLGPDALLPVELTNVGIQAAVATQTPGGVTLYLDSTAAGRLIARLHQPQGPSRLF
ncbi:DUF6292 family protein [Streptomyces niveus]|uniref:DUF6292 family protein n=1 Tax=Streptomyces niveus TaxID=193462 RepID=UPI00342108EA